MIHLNNSSFNTTHKVDGKLHFSPFNYWIISIPPFIYKIKQFPPLFIKNMQIAPIV